MSRLILYMAMSLDGFITGPGRAPSFCRDVRL